MKRITALLLACGLILAALCGCGRASDLTVTLRTMSTLGDTAEYNVYSGLLAEFSAANPDIYVRDMTVRSADAFRLKASEKAVYKASDAPHVVYFGNSGGLSEVSEYLVPIDEIIDDYPDFIKGISVEVLNSMRTEDGRTYCVPVMGEWTALAVNKSLFKQNSVQLPTDWSSLNEAITRFSSLGVIPFANSADGGSAILEALIRAYGGSDAVSLGLDGYSNIIDPYWKYALEYYRQMCVQGAFAPAAETEYIRSAFSPLSSAFIEQPTPPESYDSALGADRDRSLRTDPCELFNNGLAAMIMLDNSSISGINYTENCEVIRFPSPLGDGWTELPGGFRSGFAITRRAYDDPNLREAAVAFVDIMTGTQACSSYAALGYLPADGSALTEGIVKSVCMARDNTYFVSARSGAALSRWNNIDRMTGQMYYGIITPENICAALANPELVWVDPTVIAQPPEVVSGSDQGAVSDSDAQPGADY